MFCVCEKVILFRIESENKYWKAIYAAAKRHMFISFIVENSKRNT